ncbi:hypothetical protein CEXT_723651 [Caerostris extrusa]|uniref:Uncharacterized protein n=1 Tax=Caerostris extrusa TaxID=172846 RepID=A0AAV4M5D9_CAEEX|nr:hypothetical protein CEXT_723651 [Caerostris extrusa]
MRGQIQLHPLPTSRGKKCAWETDADLTSLVATAIDFSQQTDTLQHPLKRTANICMSGTNSAPSPSYLQRQRRNGQHLHEGDKFSSILPTSRGKRSVHGKPTLILHLLVATAIDFSQQTDTLQHPLKGNGQHLHEGDKFSSIPFLPPEAKKCAWETDADFTSLVATAIDFSQQTDTLQHPLKGTANICMRGTNSAPSPSYLRGKEIVHGKPTLILHLW